MDLSQQNALLQACIWCLLLLTSEVWALPLALMAFGCSCTASDRR